MVVFQDFQKAIERLAESLAKEKSDITRDSSIKRFEICFDLAWKSIKTYAQKEGIECISPRSCFKTAFQLKLINDDENWFKMIDDRNTTSHLYGEKLAETVYDRLQGYLGLFQNLAEKLQTLLG